MEEKYNNLKLAERGARISIIAYVMLSIFKLIVGYISNSKALMADGLNNTTDIIASFAVLIGLKISRKPADENHPYGHLRAETIASMVAAFIMIAVGLDVLYNAVRAIVSFEAQAPDLVASIVGIICAIFIYFVYKYNKKLALQLNSSGLMAAAKDNLSDAWVSIGTSVGIIASRFGMPWLDPLAAFVVGILICKTAWDIFIEASHTLTDGFEKSKLEEISKSISEIKGVKAVSDVKGRVHGSSTLLDIVIKVDDNLNVIESHKITEKIEEKMKSDYKITDLIIHVEPNYDSLDSKIDCHTK